MLVLASLAVGCAGDPKTAPTLAPPPDGSVAEVSPAPDQAAATGADGGAGDATAAELLKKPPFALTDINISTPDFYRGALPIAVATAEAPGAGDHRATVRAALSARFAGDVEKLEAALAVMDDPALLGVVAETRLADGDGELKLRAAVAFLRGTVYDGAIDVLRAGTYAQITFKDFAFHDPDARVLNVPGRPRPEIAIARKSRFEPLWLLALLIGHECLHQDAVANTAQGYDGAEETIAQSLDALFVLHAVAENPGLAQTGTRLTRMYNTMAIARGNSRKDGQLRLREAEGNILPGSAFPSRYFLEPFSSISDSSPGNAYLDDAIFRASQQRPPAGQAHFAFAPATLDVLDRHQTLLGTEALIRALESGLKLQIR